MSWVAILVKRVTEGCCVSFVTIEVIVLARSLDILLKTQSGSTRFKSTCPGQGARDAGEEKGGDEERGCLGRVVMPDLSFDEIIGDEGKQEGHT